MADLILALDQGTTSTRAVVFNMAGAPVASHSVTLQQYFPKPGWVEHDADEIWETVISNEGSSRSSGSACLVRGTCG